jgi:D-beta-D-heptose 7-phosphate kinase/D-beta-D-heptose 1-phosphate adenosyltransferase
MIVVLGDALLDRDLDGRVERLSPDAPVPVVDEPEEHCRPGGAALAAVLAGMGGREVVLVTALARDHPGRALARLLAGAGVTVVDLGLSGPTPEKVRVRAEGRSLLRVDRGVRPGAVGALTAAGRRALAGARAVLVADYGRGLAAEAGVRAALARLPSRVPLVWDPHPRGAVPVPGARLATPNRAEAARFAPEVAGAATATAGGGGLAVVTARARALAGRWGAAGVAVTLGAQGALLVGGDAPPLVVPAPPAPTGDPCGAGDRFAAAATGLLAGGALPSEAVAGAVAVASAFVAAGGAAAVRLPGQPDAPAPARIEGPSSRPLDGPAWAPGAVAHDLARSPGPVVRDQGRASDPLAGGPAWPDRVEGGAGAGGGPVGMAAAEQVVAAVRTQGGTVVATGGCFDLLHAGHVATLRAARSLGDCLVVCLNSDRSVRRLKGADRPLVAEADRAAVLAALGCVDAVVVFDEPTPEAVLDRLRPDVFAKGGDYALSDLPEAALLASWGGQAVVLPYLPGRSTTNLVKEVVRRGNG